MMPRSTSHYTAHERSFGIAVFCAWTCSWCRRMGNDEGDPDGQSWAIDHIKPRSAGGSDDLSNKTLSCTACNSEKKDRRYLAPPHPPLTDQMLDDALAAWYREHPRASSPEGMAQKHGMVPYRAEKLPGSAAISAQPTPTPTRAASTSGPLSPNDLTPQQLSDLSPLLQKLWELAEKRARAAAARLGDQRGDEGGRV